MLALAALGLTLIFGVLDVVNFAHGTYVMLAMYASYWAWKIGGIDPFVATLLVGPLFFVFGVICERLVIQPVIDRPMYAQVFGTVGLLWIFENGALALWGPDTKSITSSYGGFSVFGVAVQESRLIGFVIAVVVTGLLILFLNRTKTGLAIRATAQTRELAEPFGVNIERIFMITFGLGIALTGIAGAHSWPRGPYSRPRGTSTCSWRSSSSPSAVSAASPGRSSRDYSSAWWTRSSPSTSPPRSRPRSTSRSSSS